MEGAGGRQARTEAGPDLSDLQRLRPRLLRIAHRLVASRRLPDDCAADVLCGAFRRLFEDNGCPPGVPLKNLLIGHMLNEAKVLSRGTRHVVVGSIDGEPDDDEAPAQEALRAEFTVQGTASHAEERARIGRDLVRRALDHLANKVQEDDDVDAYVLLENFLAAYRAGAEKREDVCLHTGLSPAAYEAAKKKLRYHFMDLPSELYVAITEFISPRRSRP